MSVDGQLRVILGIDHTADDDLSLPFERLPTFNFDIGGTDGPNQMDLMWHNQSTLSGSSSDSIDLSGVLKDRFGVDAVFDQVKLMVIKSSRNNTTDIEVGGGANALSNWVLNTSDVVIVKPGGSMFIYTIDSYSVTAGTADILTITNGGGSSAEYDIYIGGNIA